MKLEGRLGRQRRGGWEFRVAGHTAEEVNTFMLAMLACDLHRYRPGSLPAWQKLAADLAESNIDLPPTAPAGKEEVLFGVRLLLGLDDRHGRGFVSRVIAAVLRGKEVTEAVLNSGYRSRYAARPHRPFRIRLPELDGEEMPEWM
jgi:hypothetical protein